MFADNRSEVIKNCFAERSILYTKDLIDLTGYSKRRVRMVARDLIQEGYLQMVPDIMDMRKIKYVRVKSDA